MKYASSFFALRLICSKKKNKTKFTTFCYLPTTTAQRFRFGCLYTFRRLNNYTGNANFIATVLYFNKIFQSNYIFSLLFFLPYIPSPWREAALSNKYTYTNAHSPSSSLNNLWYEMIKEGMNTCTASPIHAILFHSTVNYHCVCASPIVKCMCIGHIAERPEAVVVFPGSSCWKCWNDATFFLMQRLAGGQAVLSSAPAQCSKTLNLFMIFFCIFYFYFYYCAANTI